MAELNKRTPRGNNHSDAHTHAGRRAVSTKDQHSHVADEEETYEKIVGSLGEVDDEGCLDLDGVRFIANDVAYSGDTDSHDYTSVLKAMVLGDILNNPRFKGKPRR